jgi:hypothetical protein
MSDLRKPSKKIPCNSKIINPIMSNTIDKFPTNVWICKTIDGTISGTVSFKKSNILDIFSGKEQFDQFILVNVTSDNGEQHKKQFDTNDYDNVKDATIEANKYMINLCYSLGIVTNIIRVSNNNILEVMLTDGDIMKTDLVFLPLFVPISEDTCSNIVISKIESDKKTYIMVQGTDLCFHQLIMKSKHVEHINGDIFENLLSNLRYLDHDGHHNCYRKIGEHSRIENVNDKYYLVTGNINDHSCEKSFSIEKYGKQKAKYLATIFRKNILEMNIIEDDLSEIEFDENDIQILEESLLRTSSYVYDSFDERLMHDLDDYLSEIYNGISPTKVEIYSHYLITVTTYLRDLLESTKSIDKILENLERNNKNKSVIDI